MSVAPGASMSELNPITAPPSSAVAQPNDPTTIQNHQDQKEAFLTKPGDAATRNTGALQAPSSPYTVMAGTIIPAALVTGINSDLPGQVIASVTQPVYDTATGRYLLIPQGSRLIGRYDSQVAFGQRRVLLVGRDLRSARYASPPSPARRTPARIRRPACRRSSDGVDRRWMIDLLAGWPHAATLPGVSLRARPAEIWSCGNRQRGDRTAQQRPGHGNQVVRKSLQRNLSSGNRRHHHGLDSRRKYCQPRASNTSRNTISHFSSEGSIRISKQVLHWSLPAA